MVLPPELVLDIKDILLSRDLYVLTQTCSDVASLRISDTQTHLRRCGAWFDPTKFKMTCEHYCCWKYYANNVTTNLDMQKYQYHLCFSSACRLGDLKLVRLFCEEYGLTKIDMEYYDFEALHAAIQNGHIHVVRYLCESSFSGGKITLADIKSKNNLAICTAAENGHYWVLRYLCEKYDLSRDDIMEQNNYALQCAALHGNLKIMKFICDFFNFRAKHIRSSNNFVVKNAIKGGHLRMVQYIICKFNLNLEDLIKNDERCGNNNCVVCRASHFFDYLHIVQWLHDYFDFSFDFVKTHFNRIITYTAKTGNLSIIRFFCETEFSGQKITNLDYQNNNNYALREAIFNGHLHIIQYFCENYNVTIHDIRKNNNQILINAACEGNLLIVQYLCESLFGGEKITIHDVRTDRNYALRYAALHGHVEVVQYLCETYPFTAEDYAICDYAILHAASKNNHWSMVEYLCKKMREAKEISENP